MNVKCFTCCFFTLFFSIIGISQINIERQKQLDSIVTNLNKKTLKNLDSLHFVLHHFGTTNEERVFMYFGLFPIHYRYDMKRFWQRAKKSKEYTCYYTAEKRSGVCRDFSALFQELCKRSDIPCVEVTGKVPHGILMGSVKFVTFKFRAPNHSWNLVKYNNTWHHMDVTWGKIKKEDKYVQHKKNGETFYNSKVKIVDRTYFDIKSKELYAKRKPIHPVYIASDTVLSYKTIKKKKSKQKILFTDYKYESILDSLAEDCNYLYSRVFNEESKSYSNYYIFQYYLSYQFSFLENKRTKLNPLSVEECSKHIENFKALNYYLMEEGLFYDSKKYHEHQHEVFKLREKLLK